MASTEINPLHAFADWTANVQPDWSDVARQRARDAFIDIIGVIVPGAREAVSIKAYELAKSWGVGASTAIGFDTALSPPLAALVNGTSAHALDFDDNFDPAKAHATAVLAPALMALAEDRDMPGARLIDAYIVGLQIIGRVGQGVNPYHRARGWHATATVGAVGSAAGCARLIGLDAEKTAHAISIATSQAGGFMSQFGTMTKPLHAGLAAMGAVQAALFAEAGITAGDETLHGKTGMGTLMVGPDVEELRASMAGRAEHGQTVSFARENIGEPLHIEAYGLKVKRFPNCGSVHRALDGLLALKEQHQFAPSDVEEVFVRAPAAHLRNLMYERPENPMEAKFSLEYGIAVGLLRSTVGLDEYDEAHIHDPEITALLSITRKDYVEKLESEFPTEIHVRLKSGVTHSTKVEMPVGSTSLPLSEQQLWDKFSACTKKYMSHTHLSQLKKMLSDFETIASTRDLMRSI